MPDPLHEALERYARKLEEERSHKPPGESRLPESEHHREAASDTIRGRQPIPSASDVAANFEGEIEHPRPGEERPLRGTAAVLEEDRARTGASSSSMHGDRTRPERRAAPGASAQPDQESIRRHMDAQHDALERMMDDDAARARVRR